MLDESSAQLEFKTQYTECQWETTDYASVTYDVVLYEKKGHAALITFNRPEKSNALNDRMFDLFLAALHQASDDPDVKVIVLKGAGRYFCAGHDLSITGTGETSAISPDRNPRLVDYYNFERRRCSKHEDEMNYPKPIIAQVHGRCIGAGEWIAASCDLIIAAEDAIFGMAGFGSLICGNHDLPGVWPLGSQKRYAGHIHPEITAREAEAAGFITKAVPAVELETEVNNWVEAISRIPLESLVVTKEWINTILDVEGIGAAWHSHYTSHIGLQYIRWHPEEVNFYKDLKTKGLKGYFINRAKASAVEESPQRP